MKNFFNAIGVADMERVHSAMIAWILDDENDNTLSSTNPSQFTTFSKNERSCLLCELFGVDKKKFQSIKTHVEWYDIDILIETEDFDGNKEVWVIENKVKSNQHSNQLDKYVNIIKGNEKTKGKNPQPLCTKYDVSDDKQHYCFLTLIEEKPQGTHSNLWHKCLYSNFYSWLSKPTLSGIVKEYADCLSELTGALEDFLNNYKDYKNVFSDGSKKKEEKDLFQIKNNNNGQYAPYIAEYGLETIFQKCFLAEMWKNYITNKYIFYDKDWSISETNGTALLDIILDDIKLKSDTHPHHVQIEFQNGTFKIQFYQIDESKEEFLKKWKKIFNGGKSCFNGGKSYKDKNNETWKVNYPKLNSNRSYISISKKIGNNWWKEDREKMLKQWCEYLQKCKNALDQIIVDFKNQNK